MHSSNILSLLTELFASEKTKLKTQAHSKFNTRNFTQETTTGENLRTVCSLLFFFSNSSFRNLHGIGKRLPFTQKLISTLLCPTGLYPAHLTSLCCAVWIPYYLERPSGQALTHCCWKHESGNCDGHSASWTKSAPFPSFEVDLGPPTPQMAGIKSQWMAKMTLIFDYGKIKIFQSQDNEIKCELRLWPYCGPPW